MNERVETKPAQAAATNHVGELGSQIDLALKKSAQLQRPFFVVLLQVEGMETYRKRRDAAEVNRLLRDVYGAVRRAVHPSQYVGVFKDGLALVFDAAEPGQVDLISRRLQALCQQSIRAGGYNDLTSKWSDILFQFLTPGANAVLVTKVGWSIYPRDGATSTDILKRAWAHLLEKSR